MKKACLTILFAYSLCRSSNASAQTDSSVTFDMLKAPPSPAFVLLGVSPTDIQKPTDPTQLSFNLNNASNGFTALPKNYSLQIAPFWIFNGKSQTLDDFISGKHAIPQTLTISLGTSTSDSASATTQTSLGINFSIIRPAINEKTKNDIDAYKRQLSLLNHQFDSADLKLRTDNSMYHQLDSTARSMQKNLLVEQSSGKASAEKIKEDSSMFVIVKNKLFAADSMLVFDSIFIQKQDSNLKRDVRTVNLDSLVKTIQDDAKNLTFTRAGFNLDFSAGAVMDFPDQNISKGNFSRAGAWLTGSYSTSTCFDVVFVARWLYGMNLPISLNDSLVQKNANNLDIGAKLNYNKDKVSVSLEYLDRHYFENDFMSTYRLVFNASYSFAPNKALTFSFGRDFDGTITKNGTLVSALNLLLGFGGKKTL